MGTWSHEPFGNDTANDWAYGLENATNFAYIEETLDRVLECGQDYLEASDAEEAIAAIEVIAKLLGAGTQSDAYTKKIDQWVQGINARPTPALCDKAKQVLHRVVSGDSELDELWKESDEATNWKRSIEQLRLALGN